MAKNKAKSKEQEPMVFTHFSPYRSFNHSLRSTSQRQLRTSRRMVGNCPTTLGGPRKNTLCYYCREKGHGMRGCPEKRNLEGSAGGAITTNQGPRKKPGHGFNCFICSDPGHYVRDCPQRKKLKRSHDHEDNSSPALNESQKNDACSYGKDAGPRASKGHQKKQSKCYRCDDPGHYVKDCPIKRKDKQIVDTITINFSSDEENPINSKEEQVATTKVLPLDQETTRNDICTECGKAGHVAQHCPPLRQVGQGACFTCGQTGHYYYNCPVPYCLYCKKYHYPDDCLKTLIACRRCGAKGHEKSQCTVNCPNCGGDHLPGECPTRKMTCFLCEGQDHCPKDCSMSLLLTKAAEIQRMSLQIAIGLVRPRVKKK